MTKATDLHKVWSAPDNTRLTAKQYSFRLPVQVAAKLFAFCDMYPNKTRTDIVSDLLWAAVEEAVNGFPYVKGSPLYETDPETREELYHDVGPWEQFRQLANKHYEALERELGTEEPAPLYEHSRTYVAE